MRIVAFGGGHGLAASLRALRLLKAKLDLDLTAVVTVGDDGGSSGRLRADRGGLPPGDLRQALAALADPDDPVGMHAADLLQYRFPGEDPLAGTHVGAADKDRRVVQILWTAGEDRAVYQVADVVGGHPAVAHDLVRAGVQRDHAVEDARMRRAVELKE